MLILSQAKVTVDGNGEIAVEGMLTPHRARIVAFLRDLGLRGMTIRYRGGRYLFSRSIDAGTQQRLRNFLVNECPVRK